MCLHCWPHHDALTTFSNRDALKFQLKLVREDLHRVTLELKDRQMKSERLECKFGVVASKAIAEDGEQKSQAYFVIKVRFDNV
jgi:hypothetical protein